MEVRFAAQRQRLTRTHGFEDKRTARFWRTTKRCRFWENVNPTYDDKIQVSQTFSGFTRREKEVRSSCRTPARTHTDSGIRKWAHGSTSKNDCTIWILTKQRSQVRRENPSSANIFYVYWTRKRCKLELHDSGGDSPGLMDSTVNARRDIAENRTTKSKFHEHFMIGEHEKEVRSSLTTAAGTHRDSQRLTETSAFENFTAHIACWVRVECAFGQLNCFSHRMLRCA